MGEPQQLIRIGDDLPQGCVTLTQVDDPAPWIRTSASDTRSRPNWHASASSRVEGSAMLDAKTAVIPPRRGERATSTEAVRKPREFLQTIAQSEIFRDFFASKRSEGSKK